MILSTPLPMPRVQPSPFDSKYPFDLMLSAPQEPFMTRLAKRLGDYCNRIMPEGYETEDGFHLGTPPSRRSANWFGENI
jgi:hypothetical protein